MKYLSDVNETGVFSFIRAVPKSIYYFVIAHFEGILCSDTRHKSRLSHVNVFLRHYGGQLKTAVEQEAGEHIDCKR